MSQIKGGFIMKASKSILGSIILITAMVSIAYADTSQLENTASGHWYQRIDTIMNWHDAKNYAESQGGYLATITSQNEQDFLWNNFGNVIDDFIWLGATDEVTEGTWQWVTGETFWLGGQPVNNAYTNWGLNEPDDLGAGQDYLAFFAKSYGHNGGWDDFGPPIDYHEKPFIIEWNFSPPVVPEPISSVMFVVGGATLLLRRYRCKSKVTLHG
jgi:hypothetical protein